MGKILQDVVKPKAHAHRLCFALQFAPWYKYLLWKKRKSESVPGKTPVRPGLRVRKARV